VIRREAHHEVFVSHGRMKLNRHPAAVEELAPDFVRHARLARAWRSLEDHEAPRPQQAIDLFSRWGGEQVVAKSVVEDVVLGFARLHDLPAALVSEDVEEGLHDDSRPVEIPRHKGARVQLRAVPLEDVLEAGEAVSGRLRDAGSEGRRIGFDPRVDASSREVAPEPGYAPSMTGAGEDSLVRGEAPRADAEIDESAPFPAREPHDARAAVGTGRRIVRVDEPRVGHAVGVVVGQTVGIANGGRREVSLLIPITEQRLDAGTQAAFGSPSEMALARLVRLSIGIVRRHPISRPEEPYGAWSRAL